MGASTTTSQITMCLHENSLDDDRDGQTVCLSCGLVLGQIYYDSYGRGNTETPWRWGEKSTLRQKQQQQQRQQQQQQRLASWQEEVLREVEEKDAAAAAAAAAEEDRKNAAAAAKQEQLLQKQQQKRQQQQQAMLPECLDIILNNGANAHISEHVQDAAMTMARKLLSKEEGDGGGHGGHGGGSGVKKRHTPEAIASYCLFSASAKLGCPRYMGDFGRYCNSTRRQQPQEREQQQKKQHRRQQKSGVRAMYNVQKMVGACSPVGAAAATAAILDPSELVGKCCQDLGISYKHSLVIAEIVSSEQLREWVGEIRSSSLLAIVLYLFAKERSLNVSLEKIQEACDNVSSTSVFRGIKKLPGHLKTNISLLAAAAAAATSTTTTATNGGDGGVIDHVVASHPAAGPAGPGAIGLPTRATDLAVAAAVAPST